MYDWLSIHVYLILVPKLVLALHENDVLHPSDATTVDGSFTKYKPATKVRFVV